MTAFKTLAVSQRRRPPQGKRDIGGGCCELLLFGSPSWQVYSGTDFFCFEQTAAFHARLAPVACAPSRPGFGCATRLLGRVEHSQHVISATGGLPQAFNFRYRTLSLRPQTNNTKHRQLSFSQLRRHFHHHQHHRHQHPPLWQGRTPTTHHRPTHPPSAATAGCTAPS